MNTNTRAPKAASMQGLAAYLRCEAGGVFEGHPSHETLLQWAREVDAATPPAVAPADHFVDADKMVQAPAVAPSEPVALPFAILADEMAALRRFDECVRDGQGYDVRKLMMKRLSEIGLVRRVTANVYEHTNFGLSVLNGDFAAQPVARELSDEEIVRLWDEQAGFHPDPTKFARAVIAADRAARLSGPVAGVEWQSMRKLSAAEVKRLIGLYGSAAPPCRENGYTTGDMPLVLALLDAMRHTAAIEQATRATLPHSKEQS